MRKLADYLLLLFIFRHVFADNCGNGLKPEKLAVVGIWKRQFDNSTSQYRISDEDLSVRGYERTTGDSASSTAMLARHPEGCVITECGVRLTAMLQKNGAILHTDHSMLRSASEMENIEDEFYCARGKNSCGADVPIYRLVKHSLNGPHYAYTFGSSPTLAGYEKEYFPICYAWRNTPSVVMFNSSDSSICLTLPQVPNGKVVYSTPSSHIYSVGATATLHCDPNFAVASDVTLVCTKDGWYPRDKLGHCVVQPSRNGISLVSIGNSIAANESWCPIPKTVSNGNIVYSANVATSMMSNSTAVPHATRATILCNLGFVPTSGATSSKCVGGDWQPMLPQCVSIFELQCPILNAPRNGELVFADKPYAKRSVVTLKCNRNFYAVGNTSSTCLDNGKWDQTIGKCEATTRRRRQISTGAACSELATPANGNILYIQANPLSSFSSGTTAYLMCNLGMSLQNSISSMCVNGAWTPPIGSCSTSLNLGNSPSSSVGTIQGSVAGCANPTVLNGQVSYSSGNMLELVQNSGTSATLTCNSGYTPTGSITAICTGGTWTPTLGTCQMGSGTGSIFPGISQTGSTCTNPTVLNGEVTYNEGNALQLTKNTGTTATLTCNPGFTLSGISQSICTAGTWTPQLGACQMGSSSGTSLIPGISGGISGGIGIGTGCTSPTVIGGTINYNQGSSLDISHPIGTTATLTCTSGYTLSGSPSATCTSGTWSPTLGTCQLGGLGGLGTIAGGSEGSTATGIQCTAMIGPLGGTVTYSSGSTMGPFSTGTTATATCSNGGSVQGGSTSTCENGMWNPAFFGTCSLISGSPTSSCSALSVPSGAQATYSPLSLSTTNFSSGTVATVSCTMGGQQLGTSTCTNGVWSPAITSVCNGATSNGNTCTPLTMTFGETVTYEGASNTQASYNTGTIARVQCSNGTSVGQTTCQGGTWSPAIVQGACSGSSTSVGTQCISILASANSQVTYSDGTNVLHNTGTTSTIQCTSGTLEGSSTSTCQNGVWSPTLGTCSGIMGTTSGQCYAPPAAPIGANLTYSSKNMTFSAMLAPWSSGSTVTLSCPSGQSVIGTSTSTCENGNWTPSLGTCSGGIIGAGCSPLSASLVGTVPNGQMTYTPAITTRVPIGTRVRVVCFAGFQLQDGPDTSTCTIGGWHPPTLGTCLAASSSSSSSTSSCPPLSDPNITYSGPPPYSNGTVARVVCPANYTASGEVNSTCINGTWSVNSLAKCQKAPPIGLSCAFGIGGVLNADMTYSNNGEVGPYPSGTVVTATCNPGSFPNGVMSSSCQNGIWSPPSLGFCQITSIGLSTVSCPRLADNPVGTISYSAGGEGPYPTGSSATIICNLGYTLSGSPTTICTQGIWSPAPGVCTLRAFQRPQSAEKALILAKAIPELHDDGAKEEEGERCPPPIAPAFGEITFSTTSTNRTFPQDTTAALRCNLGYKSTGASFSTCHRGSFRPILGKCRNGAESALPGICVPLSPPKNARIVYIQTGSSLDFEDGTTALLYCEEGFAVTGSATLQCHGGQWEPSSGFGQCDAI